MSPVHTPRPCPATSQVQALSRAYCLDLGLHPAPLSPAPAQPGGSELAARLLWELGKQTPYLSLSGKSSKPLLLLWMECLEDLEPCVLEASGIDPFHTFVFPQWYHFGNYSLLSQAGESDVDAVTHLTPTSQLLPCSWCVCARLRPILSLVRLLSPTPTCPPPSWTHTTPPVALTEPA